MSWRDIAACRHADPDLFFPVGSTGPALHQIEEAKAICRTCPVRAPCLNWALSHEIFSGVWGGTTEEERRDLYKEPVCYREPVRDDRRQVAAPTKKQSR